MQAFEHRYQTHFYLANFFYRSQGCIIFERLGREEKYQRKKEKVFLRNIPTLRSTIKRVISVKIFKIFTGK